MSFVSVNSERDTTKTCALFLLSSFCSLFSISLSNAWHASNVLSGLEIMRTVFSLGFYCWKSYKEAKTRQWKAVKNILKVNWIENKNISASYARENSQLGINLIKIAQEARWKWGGGGGVVAGFDQDANKYMTSKGISYLVISFAL